MMFDYSYESESDLDLNLNGTLLSPLLENDAMSDSSESTGITAVVPSRNSGDGQSEECLHATETTAGPVDVDVEEVESPINCSSTDYPSNGPAESEPTPTELPDWQAVVDDLLQPAWPNDNWKLISRLLNIISCTDGDADVILDTVRRLNWTVSLPSKVAELRRLEMDALGKKMLVTISLILISKQLKSQSYRFRTVKIDIPVPRTKSGDPMVESTDIELIHKDLLDVSIQLVNAPSQRDWIHWRYEPEFCDDADGDCPTPENKFSQSNDFPESGRESGRYDSVSELWTAQWWRDTELQLPYNLPRNILAIGIATDETVITMTGENSIMSLYSTYIIDIMIVFHY